MSVVVLNWNGWRDTLGCLDSLVPCVESGLARVIIVDNASSDDSATQILGWLGRSGDHFREFLAGEPARLCGGVGWRYALVRSETNGGYASGSNIGIRLALRCEGTEYVLILNNDTAVEPRCVASMVAFADRDPLVGVVGATVVEASRGLRIAGGYKYSAALTTSRPVVAVEGRRFADIDFVDGAAQLIRAAALRRVGLLCEDYFLYFEELDFTRRIATAGFRVAWCPDGVVHHRGGAAAGSQATSGRRKSDLAEYHCNLSCLIFMRRFHPRIIWAAAPLRFLLKVAKGIAMLQPQLLRPLVRAYRDYLLVCRRRDA